MTDDDLQRQVDALEQRLRDEGCRVTVDRSCDDRGMAFLLHIGVRALQDRVRDGRDHPGFIDLGTGRKASRWWPLDDFVHWTTTRRVPGTQLEERGRTRKNACSGAQGGRAKLTPRNGADHE
ncbi:MAG: hypothetical protein RIC56_03805 [Pseudomonadales bacterium]